MRFSIHTSVHVLSFFRIVFTQTCGECQSFGIDFISDGSYFQNSLSTDNFTAVQNFEGCTGDFSHNVLVTPNGTQYECSMTAMSPDDAPEQLTCPIHKSEMYSGEWSLLILSNNGDCEPINYERDFYLSVGPQQTTTVPPTIYISTTVTPIENDTITTTETLTSTAPPSTTTVARVTLNPTITIHPLPTITKVTQAIFTITKTRLSASVVATTTRTRKAKCNIHRQKHTADPVATIAATILSDTSSSSGLAQREALPQPTGSDGTVSKRSAREPHRAARRDRLALVKRAPDMPTSTSTDPSAAPVFSTLTSFAPTQTILLTTTLYATSTTTPVVTVRRGATASIVTVTAERRTLTKTVWTIAKATTTRVLDVTLTVVSVVTPSRAARRCSRVGGTMG